MEKNENVSINSGSHNRDYVDFNDKSTWISSHADDFGDDFYCQGIFSGCFWYDSDGIIVEKYCKDCKAAICPDYFPCLLDYRDDVYCLYSNI